MQIINRAFLILICITMFSCSAFALDEIKKKLKLKENYSHLLFFDQEIVRYRAGDEEAFVIEVLPDIYSKRHEMLIKPVKKGKTNLIVWTKEKIYTFDIQIKKGRESVEDFEIDLPPGVR